MRTGRVPEDALVCFEAVTGDRWVRAGELEMYRSLRNDAALAWQGRFLRGPPPLLTALLVGLQIRIWWSSWIPGVADTYVRRFTNFAPSAFENGEAWRLLTMGVLHTETFHIALNMMWLAYCGWNLERALGRANLLTLYVASVVGGSLLSMLGSPETRSLGASGGVFGLVAASVVFGFARPELLPERGRRLFGAAMLPYLVLMFWSGLMNEGTDNWSHFGGLVVGGALALLLDPVPLQRRPGWNRRWHVATATGIAALLLGIGVFGPRVHPIRDSAIVRAAVSASPSPRSDAGAALSWDAPAGWRSGMNPSGEAGFVSPAGKRSWAVVERDTRSPDSVEALHADWVDRLRRGFPDARIEDPVPTTLAGRPGLAGRAFVGEGAEERIVEWRGVTRGVYTLQEVWEVEVAWQRRLAPLRDRLRDRIVWGDPLPLVEAHRDWVHLPNSRKSRARYADALLRVGEVDQALELRRGLLEEQADSDAWSGMLHLLQWHPDLPDADALWDRALAEAPSSRVVTSVAQGLEAAGRHDEALALLDLAWGQQPGDRLLRRARSNRDLSTTLTADHLPWDAVHDPVSGRQRTVEEREARISEAPSLEAARRRATLRREERRRVIEAAVAAVRDGDPAGLPALLVLRHGHVPDELPAAVDALMDDARKVAEGATPSWMPDDLVATLRDHPDALAPIGLLRDDPTELERRARP